MKLEELQIYNLSMEIGEKVQKPLVEILFQKMN